MIVHMLFIGFVCCSNALCHSVTDTTNALHEKVLCSDAFTP